MNECRVSIHYDVRWNKVTDTLTDSAKRRRSRTVAGQMSAILTELGYQEMSDNFWLSPLGNETVLLSTLTYKIIEIPGLRDSLCCLYGTRVTEMPLDLLETMTTMTHRPQTSTGSLAPKEKPAFTFR